MGKDKKIKYVNKSNIIDIVDDVYILAILYYLPLKQQILIDKIDKKISAKSHSSAKVSKDVLNLKNDRAKLVRKKKHYEKWKAYYYSIDENGYDKKMRELYTIVELIFKKRIKHRKYSNWQYDTKNDGYMLAIEQVYKYFFISYRKTKKSIWKYFNNYIEFENDYLESTSKANKEPKYTMFDLIEKPSNNPFSYITSIVNTSMLNETKKYQTLRSESVYFEALIRYDIDWTNTSSVKNFENEYIFNYGDVEKEYDANNSDIMKSDSLSFDINSSNANSKLDSLHEIEIKEKESIDANIDHVITNTIDDDRSSNKINMMKVVNLDTYDKWCSVKDEEEKLLEIIEDESEKVTKKKKKKKKSGLDTGYYDFLSKINEAKKYDLSVIDQKVSNNMFIQNTIEYINRISMRDIDTDITFLNLLFCKVSSDDNTIENLYYMFNNINNGKLFEKILSSLDKKVSSIMQVNFDE